jgi:ribosomal protein S14
MTSPRTESSPAELLVHLARADSATTPDGPVVLVLSRRDIRQLAAQTVRDFAHSICGLCGRPHADHRSLELELSYDDQGRLDGITTTTCTAITPVHHILRPIRNDTCGHLVDTSA